MEARYWPLVAACTVLVALGADYRTDNFIVQAGSAQLAQTVGQEAERLRRDLALQWLPQELPAWPQPCPIRVYAGPNIPAHGATTYTPVQGSVRDFRMEIHGTPQRLLDSVLPHEVTHTVLATHFGQPLPRWADEGASTTVEHHEERDRHEQMLREFLLTRRGIPMNTMFRMREYPSDMLPLYAQGYSVSRFLIAQGGHQKFVKFLEDYFRQGSWTQVVQTHYKYQSLGVLQDRWLEWVRAGSPPIAPPGGEAANIQVVSATADALPVAAVAQVPGATPALAASSNENGWYTRRREQVAARGETNDSATLRR
jgi:hypothetical protein